MADRTLPPTARRRALKKRYNPEPLRTRVEQLLAERNESYREAALRAGLDHQAVRRILSVGQRPAVQTCILLADHFDLNLNEFLEVAQLYVGYAGSHVDRAAKDLKGFARVTLEAGRQRPSPSRCAPNNSPITLPINAPGWWNRSGM